jgi:predicted O-methyltransferase YrrM
MRSLQDQLRLARQWAWKQTEFSNYYYELTPRNRKDLAFLISHISGTPVTIIEDLFSEIENDQILINTLIDFRDKHPELRDSTMKIGRRIGWYALIRIVKPKFVVETGIHHGVGALVIASALDRNRKEGFEGEYLGTDINPKSGELLMLPLTDYCTLAIGDSVTTLQGLQKNVDFFISDSDHSEEYEAREYQSIEQKLSNKAYILSDNSHVSNALREFSEKTGRNFIFFKEEPLNHFYGGAGIGMSFRAVD